MRQAFAIFKFAVKGLLLLFGIAAAFVGYIHYARTNVKQGGSVSEGSKLRGKLFHGACPNFIGSNYSYYSLGSYLEASCQFNNRVVDVWHYAIAKAAKAHPKDKTWLLQGTYPAAEWQKSSQGFANGLALAITVPLPLPEGALPSIEALQIKPLGFDTTGTWLSQPTYKAQLAMPAYLTVQMKEQVKAHGLSLDSVTVPLALKTIAKAAGFPKKLLKTNNHPFAIVYYFSIDENGLHDPQKRID